MIYMHCQVRFNDYPKWKASMDADGPAQREAGLRVMRNSENWLSWKEIFPIADVDGTMKSRMAGTIAEGNVIAKTGTMKNVRCLSGHTFTPQEEFVFSILVNGHLLKSDDIDRVVNNILIFVTENNTK